MSRTYTPKKTSNVLNATRSFQMVSIHQRCSYKRAYLEHSLRKHMNCVHSTQTYQCDCCEREFKCLSTLRGHQRMMRSKDENRGHICEHCGAGFMTNKHLRSHIQGRVSSDNRPQDIRLSEARNPVSECASRARIPL